MLRNDETIRAVAAFGVEMQDGSYPEWILRLDELKSREKVETSAFVSHVDTVAQYTKDIALRIGIEEEKAEMLAVAALWHDVGKLAVPSELLDSPNRLNDEEMSVVKTHASKGGDFLTGAPEVFSMIARFHHERYDGHGYNGMSGEGIPLEARIVQVADVFEALVSPRAYKAGTTSTSALLKMTADNEAGAFGRRGFDPFLMRAFVSLQIERSPVQNAVDRNKLESFRDSAPMEDLDYYPGGRSPVYVHADGTRELLRYPDGVTPVTVQVVGSDGMPLDDRSSSLRVG